MRNSQRLMLVVVAALTAMIAGVYFGKTSRNATRLEFEPDITPAAMKPASAPSAAALAQLLGTSLPDESGVQHPFSQWRDKTLVINFWATWCPPCRDEMPSLSRLQEKHAANGVQFVGISLDSAPNVQKFTQQFRSTYPLLIDSGVVANLAAQLGNPQQALPFTLVLDPARQVLLQRLGQISEKQLDAVLREVRIKQ